MEDFEEIDEARKLLGLGEVASLIEIIAAYRKPSYRYHPDRYDTDERHKEAVRKLNWAYELLEDHFGKSKHRFGEEEVARTYSN